MTAIPASMRIAIITDLDHDSRVGGAEKPTWKSIYKRGNLHYDRQTNRYSVEWEDDVILTSHHSEAGRGMELSELCLFEGSMYSFDDRSGLVYEIVDYASEQPKAFPRYVLMEGDADTDKGFKAEWATVKDGRMYVGSFGKEYALDDGTIQNTNNNWVKVIDIRGRVTHVDWSPQYEKMRSVLGYEFPAYLLHETGVWSPVRREWLFLPRRMSKEPYQDVRDEKKGANTIITADESFDSIKHFRVGKLTPERGFSSAKFVPGSQDNVVVALKSEEDSAKGIQGSYITVFNMEGEVLMEETQIPGGYKYEGLEFIEAR